MKNIIFLVLQTNGKDSILSLDKISIQILLINIQFIEIIHFITFYFSHTSGVVIWSESYILMRRIRPVFRWPKWCVSTLDHDWVRMVSVSEVLRSNSVSSSHGDNFWENCQMGTMVSSRVCYDIANTNAMTTNFIFQILFFLFLVCIVRMKWHSKTW